MCTRAFVLCDCFPWIYVHMRLLSKDTRTCEVSYLQDTVIYERLCEMQLYSDITLQHLEGFASLGKYNRSAWSVHPHLGLGEACRVGQFDRWSV